MEVPEYPSAVYPEPFFPAYPEAASLPVPSNLNLTTPWVSGEYYAITEDGYYNSIVPSSSRTIVVDMAGGNREIRVGTLNLTGGNIELINASADSKLIFYVDTAFSLGSSRTFNFNGTPDQLIVYYAGTSTVTLNGASRFRGNIFVKEAPINYTAGA